MANYKIVIELHAQFILVPEHAGDDRCDECIFNRAAGCPSRHCESGKYFTWRETK